MRILGGKDYYDNALQYGIDDDIVFARKHYAEHQTYNGFNRSAREIDISFYKDNKNIVLYYYDIFVFLAGKVYSGGYIQFENHYIFNSDKNDAYIWSYADMDKFMHKNDLELIDHKGNKFSSFEDYSKRISNYNWINNSHRFDFNPRDFTPYEMEYFVKNKLSVVTIDGRQQYTYDKNNNPKQYMFNGDNLKELEFYRVLDSYTCYNEIYNWVSGILPSAGNPMVEISNQDKIHKAGFDTKTSFRHPVKL